MWYCYVEWIYVAQDRDQWRAILNTVMIFRDPYEVGNLLSSRLSCSPLKPSRNYAPASLTICNTEFCIVDFRYKQQLFP
jgi:hypothetical protein